MRRGGGTPIALRYWGLQFYLLQLIVCVAVASMPTRLSFSCIASAQTVRVPHSGWWRVALFGAAGGGGRGDGANSAGGYGCVASATIFLSSSDAVEVVVGCGGAIFNPGTCYPDGGVGGLRDSTYSGGSGGGSSRLAVNGQLRLISGGGGGGGGSGYSNPGNFNGGSCMGAYGDAGNSPVSGGYPGAGATAAAAGVYSGARPCSTCNGTGSQGGCCPAWQAGNCGGGGGGGCFGGAAASQHAGGGGGSSCSYGGLIANVNLSMATSKLISAWGAAATTATPVTRAKGGDGFAVLLFEATPSSTLTQSATHPTTGTLPHSRTASASKSPTGANESATPSSASATLPLSKSRSCTLSPEQTTRAATPTASALPPPRRPGVLNPIVSEGVATVIVAGGASSGMISGIISPPSSAGAAARVGLLASAVNCAFSDDSLTEPQPTEHPVRTSIVGSMIVGATCCTTLLLVVLPTALSHLGCRLLRGVALTQSQRSLLDGVLSVRALLVSFFSPCVVKAAVLVWLHHPTWAQAAAMVVCISLLCCVVLWLFCQVAFLFHRSVQCVQPEDARRCILTPRTPACAPYLLLYSTLVEDARDPSSMASRLCYFEDLGTSCLMAVCCGIQPADQSDCSSICVAMGVCCALHLVFLLVVRPFRTRLSSAFAYLNASMMLCTAIVAYWSGRAGSGSSVATLLAALFFICNAMFVVQFVSTAAHAIYRDEKRRRLRALDEAAAVRGTRSDLDAPVLMSPLGLVEWPASRLDEAPSTIQQNDPKV